MQFTPNFYKLLKTEYVAKKISKGIVVFIVTAPCHLDPLLFLLAGKNHVEGGALIYIP